MSASEDAAALRQAMKGFGTDDKALIQILATRNSQQIQAIRATYSRWAIQHRDPRVDGAGCGGSARSSGNIACHDLDNIPATQLLKC